MKEKRFKFWLGHTKKMTHAHTLADVHKIIPEFTDDIITLEYIGLKDKEGNEIFEGDILESEGFLVNVEWKGSSCGFEPFSDSEGNCGHCGVSEKPSNWTVIGNIYENSQLLEKLKNQ